MRAQTALCWYSVIFAGLLSAVLAAGLTLRAGNAVGWSVEPFLVIWVTLVTFLDFSGCSYCIKAADSHQLLDSEDSHTREPLDSTEHGASTENRARPNSEAYGSTEEFRETRQPGRLYWMDNLKLVLIVLVIFGHSGMAFTGAGGFIGFSGPDILSSPNWYAPTVWSSLNLLKPLVVPLFFLVSGYFAAASLAKKGVKKLLLGSFW